MMDVYDHAMPSVITPSKRAFAVALAKLHERSGMEAVDTARVLGCSPTTVGRYLVGKTLPRSDDLATMLNLYNATADQRSEIDQLLLKARGTTRRLRAPEASPKFRSFLRAEADADKVKTLSPIAVPGLLQTEAYAAAVHRAAHALTGSAISIERAVAARMSRQRRLLLDSNPLELHAVVDESVIRKAAALGVIGDEQLAHLVAMAGRPNVTLQVIPYEAGMYGTMSGPMTLFEYADAGSDSVIYLEYPGGGAWVASEDIGLYAALLAEARELALSPDLTTALITQARR